MARELRFTDPAFRCEVVLSGTAKRHPKANGANERTGAGQAKYLSS
jgi:hypothetical protein